MSFPRYPKYRDSGVEWLGEVPEHWKLNPVKNVARLFGRIGFRGYTTADIVGQGEGAITLSPSNITESGMFFGDCTFISWDKYRESPEIMIRPHDVLMVKTGSTLGKVAYVPDCDLEMTVNPQIVVFKQITCNPRYLFRLLSTPYIQACVEVKNAGSSIPTITQQSIGNFTFALPPQLEQAAITAFLDRETAKIDGLVGEQRRLIELLKEKRQAVISHAVTKGLNPHAPMKPSGIEWLGDVPEHWDCASLTRISERVVVGIAEAATHAYADEGIPILRSTNIRPGRIIGDILYVNPVFAGDRDSKRLAAGDLVTVRTGNAGVTALIPKEFDGCQCFTMLITTLNKQSVGTFYCYWMNSVSAQCYFLLEGWGTAQVNISVPILKALPIPIPPTREQNAIVEYLDDVVPRFDNLTAEAERAIDLLQERRTALISAAVTGKIDVRGLVKMEAA